MNAEHTATLAPWHDLIRNVTSKTLGRHALVGVLVLTILAVDPALAKPPGESFCKTALVKTGRNVLTVIQFGGPLLGAILVAGSAVMRPAIRRSDRKKELTEVRNQALVWGVLVAPLSTTIVQFLLNAVVAGGASCGF